MGLTDFIEQEKITDPRPWVDGETYRRVEHAVRNTGADPLRPVFEFLNGEVPYDSIRICIACIRNAT